MDTRKLGLSGLLLLVLIAPACQGREETGTTAQSQDSGEEAAATGLKIEDVKVGDGAEAVPGSTVSVHYVGTLESGEQFDSSRDRGQPFEFQLGAGQVIPGWDEGVANMQVGGIRKLTIPPELAYGAAGAPPSIPPNATLLFEIELLDVRPA